MNEWFNPLLFSLTDKSIIWSDALIPYPLYLFIMKYIITENQLDRFISKWLSKEYTDLEIYDHDNQPWSLYVNKDGEIIFLYHSKDNELYVSQDVMKFLSNVFSIDDLETRTILKDWFEEHNNLKTYKVIPWDFNEDWKKILRWETKKRLP